jgi:hypothetical protein
LDKETRFTYSQPSPDLAFAPPPAGKIEDAYLADGVRRLSLRDSRATRPRGAESGTPLGLREPARLITMAWGESYIGYLLEITIPALLAAGNLPALAGEFDCEFVLVTETQFFDRVARSGSIQELLRFADLRLVPIDDLLSPWYGITLTYALVRGIADLGSAMTDTHLIFLNADFIVADGSYRKLAKVIKAGARLVVSPSYCMDLEATIDLLRERRDPATGALSISKRELSEIIISHRHNTIRAKTVNQQMFRIHRYDQFYWYVDEKTLLGRQMPIAVIYMRPERVLTEMPTFWDYGVISEYCPTTEPCVLGDSDDFLMAELRSEGTFRELLHLGWPTVAEIAADLSSFTTQDHRDYGRHALVLHSDDLPPDLDVPRRELARFVDHIYEQLTPPISYRDHPFWKPQFPLFLARHQEEQHKRQAREAVRQRLLRQDPREALRQKTIDELRMQTLMIEGAMRQGENRVAVERRSLDERLSGLEDTFRCRREALECEIESLLGEHEKDLRRLRKELATLDARRIDLENDQNSVIDRLCLGPCDGDVDAQRLSGAVDQDRIQMPRPTPRTTWPRVIRFYQRAFGRLPATTRWHPYHTMLRPVMAALGTAPKTAEILVVSSGGPFGTLITREFAARHLVVTPGMLASELYRQVFRSAPKFDLCVCELAADDLANFRDLFGKVRPFMKSHSRIIVFHDNLAGRSLDERTFEFTRGLFPLIGRSRISFTGSYISAPLIRWFASRLTRHNLARLESNIAFAATLAICAPLARFASRIEERQNPRRFRAHCTSLTIEIDLP